MFPSFCFGLLPFSLAIADTENQTAFTKKTVGLTRRMKLLTDLSNQICANLSELINPATPVYRKNSRKYLRISSKKDTQGKREQIIVSLHSTKYAWQEPSPQRPFSINRTILRIKSMPEIQCFIISSRFAASNVAILTP